MNTLTPTMTSTKHQGLKVTAVRALWIGLTALGVCGSEFFLFHSPFVNLAFLFCLFVVAGLAAFTALVLGSICWRTGGKTVSLGAGGLLIFWCGIVVVGYIALQNMRLPF